MNNLCLKKEVAPERNISVWPSRLPTFCVQLYFPPHSNSMYRLYFYSLATKYTGYCIAPIVYYNTNLYLYNIKKKMPFPCPRRVAEFLLGVDTSGKTLKWTVRQSWVTGSCLEWKQLRQVLLYRQLIRIIK